MIEIRNLTKSFDNSTIIRNITTTINEGDVIAVIGPSGTGKSTFIRCLNLLNTPTGGQILLDGEDITSKDCDVRTVRRKIGMVFQQFNLFNHLTILENAIVPQVDILGRTRQEACDKAMKYLRMVGMEDKILRYPDALSGGQKQRAAIARTLSMDPEIILFDEPTSALDPTLVGEVEYIIEKLAKEGRTMMIVTHEMRFAKKVANRVFYMDEGGIYEDGSVDQIFNHPRKEKTRQFINKLKCLRLDIDPRSFSMPETVAAVNNYGQSVGLSGRCMYRLQAAFEELCVQNILPQLKDGCLLHVSIESAYENEDLKMVIRYDGEPVDFEKNSDSITGDMLKFAAESIDYGDNSVTALIKK